MKSPKNWLILVLGLLAVGGGVFAWQEYQELIVLRAQALGSSQDLDRLRQAVRDADKRTKQLTSQLAAQRSQNAAEAAAADTPGNQQNRTLGNFTSDYLKRMDDPEIRRLMAIQQRAQINRQYAALFKHLNLAPDLLTQFQNLLLEKRTVQLDVLAAATQQGINPMQNPADFKQLVDDAQAELDQKIQSALGPDDYAQFQNFQQTQGQRNVVNQLQQDLNYTEAPLTSAQQDQMIQVLAQTSPSKNGTGNKITDATIAQAQSILSPVQVQALQGIQQQQQAAAQLRKLMQQAQAPKG